MQNSAIMGFASSDSWTILSSLEQSIKRKIDAIGTPLRDWNISINYGIKTGFNDAFIISGELKDQLIALDQKSAEIIRPILRGRDIKRYGYSFADLWLINAHNGIKDKSIARVEISDYPAIKAHLDTCYEKLAKRADKGDTPYNLRNCAYMDDFSKQKIVWGNLCLSSQFAFIEDEFFINAPSPMIVPGNKYLLAVLNSKLGDWYIRNLGVTRNGGYFEYKPMFVEQLPIPIISDADQAEYSALVDTIYGAKAKGEETNETEAKIDQLVYNLYGLTDEEISFIER